MIYVIAAIIGIFLGIRYMKGYGNQLWKVVVAACITIFCLIIGFLINAVFAISTEHDIVEVTEVSLGINPITNQYFVVTEEGKILTDDDIIFKYSTSKDISEPTAKQYKTRKDLGIWGFDDIDYDYHIIIPAA